MKYTASLPLCVKTGSFITAHLLAFCSDTLPEVSQERYPNRASTNHYRLASRTTAAPRPPRALGIPSPGRGARGREPSPPPGAPCARSRGTVPGGIGPRRPRSGPREIEGPPANRRLPAAPLRPGPAPRSRGRSPSRGPAGRQGEQEPEPGAAAGLRLPAAPRERLLGAGGGAENPAGSWGCGGGRVLRRRRLLPPPSREIVFSEAAARLRHRDPPAPAVPRRRAAGSGARQAPGGPPSPHSAGCAGRSGSSGRRRRMPALRHPAAAAAWTALRTGSAGEEATAERRRPLLSVPGR